MLSNKIKVKRYIGHNCCDGFLLVNDGYIIFEPLDYDWESLKFQFLVSDINGLEIYDIFTMESYEKEYLSSKALSISTKSSCQYIIGYENIEKLLNMLKLISLKYDIKKRIS